MGNSYTINFKSMIGYDDLLHYKDIELTSTEVYALWSLGTYGPMTSYALYHKKANFPYPEDAILIPKEKILELKKNPTDYYRSTIDDSIIKLESKGLVKTLYEVSKRKKIAGLTFSGLIWYLQNTKDGFNRILDYYSVMFPLRTVKKQLLCKEYENLLPFLPFWNSMTKALGKIMCLERFEKTTKDFFALKETKLKIDAPNIEVEGYLKSPPPLWLRLGDPEYYGNMAQRCIGERNQKVVDFIKKPENLMLLNSYIAYLAIHDLNEISKCSLEETIKIQSKLNSEIELSFLECRKIGTNSIFNKERLQEFFPKYSGINYFFTGMFIEKLIWSKTR